MLTAKQAREKIDAMNKPLMKEELDNIEVVINKAVERGDTSVVWTFEWQQNKSKIQGLGYGVRSMPTVGVYEVSW